MDELPEVAPGELQPRKVAARQDWVAKFAGRREARLVADYDLLTEVMFESFQGPAWDKMAKRLVAYGLVVIKSWLRRGVIFNRCVEKGFGGIPNAQHGGITDEDDVMGLANETVWLAVLAYRDKVLIPGRWDPRKGANLTTYFIGQCLIQFPTCTSAGGGRRNAIRTTLRRFHSTRTSSASAPLPHMWGPLVRSSSAPVSKRA